MLTTQLNYAAQDFQRRAKQTLDECREELQKDFLFIAAPLIEELGIESFGWNQLDEFNDENHDIVYLMDSMYIYINGANHSWRDDERADSTDDSKREIVYNFLRNIQEDTMQIIFGRNSITVYADRIEIDQKWGY